MSVRAVMGVSSGKKSVTHRLRFAGASSGDALLDIKRDREDDFEGDGEGMILNL
jgi:hypothetical protein